MGKKRVKEKTEETILGEAQKETSKLEAVSKTSPYLTSKKTTKAKAYISASYNNTIITLTDSLGNVLAWSSAGLLGFKGTKKSTAFAAARVAEVLTEKAKKLGVKDLEIFIRGVGSGRDSAIRSLVSHGLNVVSIEDMTPLPHNGCKPPRPRRV